MTDLRPYQTDVIGRLREAVAAGKRRILLVAPTGSGKTVIAANIAAGAAGKKKRALALAHRRELYQYPAPAPNFAEWVITELDNPFLVDNPLPRSCKIVLQEDSIILAHCWRQP